MVKIQKSGAMLISLICAALLVCLPGDGHAFGVVADASTATSVASDAQTSPEIAPDVTVERPDAGLQRATPSVQAADTGAPASGRAAWSTLAEACGEGEVEDLENDETVVWSHASDLPRPRHLAASGARERLPNAPRLPGLRPRAPPRS